MATNNMFSLAFIASLGLAGCGEASRPTGEAAPLSFAAFRALEAERGISTESEPTCGDTCQEYRQELRYVVYVGKEIYCYWDLKQHDSGHDYDALATTLETSITDDTTFPEYFMVLTRWAAALRDGHVNVYPPEDMNQLELFEAPLSLSVLAAGTDHERAIVTTADPTSGLQAGDEVVKINGLELHAALDQLDAVRSGSTARMRRSRPSVILHAMGAKAAAADLRLTIKRAGAEQELDVFRTSTIVPPPTPAPTPDLTAYKSVYVKILPGNIGYLRVDTFYADKLADVLASAMDRLTDTRGLVIDVRRNGGGDLTSGNTILARLIAQPATRYEVSENRSDFVLHERPWLFLSPQSDDPRYTAWHAAQVRPATERTYVGKPVVLLTGPRCFSACDTFTAALKSNGLATIMGEGTGGGTGSPLEFTLPVTGLTFRYSVVRGRTSAGQWIEGSGTLPDVVVEADAATAVGAADNQVAAAYAYLKDRLAAGDTTAPASVGADVARAFGSVYVDAPSSSRFESEWRDERRLRGVSEL